MTSTSSTVAKFFVVIFTFCLIQRIFSAPVKIDWCSDGMDIALLIDTSWYDSSDWASVLETAKKLVDTFDVSESGNHFAIMTFGKNPVIEMKFDRYNGTDLNSAKIKGVIDGLKASEGPTFIDKALLAAEKAIFTSEEGMRRDNKKVAIVLTDGMQTYDRGPYTPLYSASSTLETKGVEIYSIGFGLDINVLSLIEIATSDNNVYSSAEFLTDLMEFKNEICGKNKSTMSARVQSL